MGVLVVVARPVGRVGLDGRRPRGEGPAPRLYLRLAVPLHCLALVQARQRPVPVLVRVEHKRRQERGRTAHINAAAAPLGNAQTLPALGANANVSFSLARTPTCVR